MMKPDNFFLYLNNAFDEFEASAADFFEAVDNLKRYLADNPDLATNKPFKAFIDKFAKLAAMAIPARKAVTKIIKIRDGLNRMKNKNVGYHEIHRLMDQLAKRQWPLIARQVNDVTDQLNKAKTFIKDLTPEEAEPITIELNIMAISVPDLTRLSKDLAKMLLGFKK